MLHVWYIYLHLPEENHPNVGKYTIHGAYGYGSIPISTIFRVMNIHLPAILMFTRGTRFWHAAIWVLLPDLNSNVAWFEKPTPDGDLWRLEKIGVVALGHFLYTWWKLFNETTKLRNAWMSIWKCILYIYMSTTIFCLICIYIYIISINAYIYIYHVYWYTYIYIYI